MNARIACCQFAPDVEHPEGNAVRASRAIADALEDGSDIVVLPELSNSGYVLSSTEEARAAAEPVGGPLLSGWAEQARAHDAVVIGGFCELGDDGRVFNSSALVDGSGVAAVYRKTHLWGEEPRWFVPGEAPAPVVDTRFGRVGLAICYDLEFPELTRGLALAGAELLALPTNYPQEPSVGPAGEPMLSVVASATAYLSRVFVAVCDRCGSERGLTFEGGSVIAGPDGSLLARPPSDHGKARLVADVALKEASDKRWGPHNDAFADRRPEHYAASLNEARPLVRAAG